MDDQLGSAPMRRERLTSRSSSVSPGISISSVVATFMSSRSPPEIGRDPALRRLQQVAVERAPAGIGVIVDGVVGRDPAHTAGGAGRLASGLLQIGEDSGANEGAERGANEVASRTGGTSTGTPSTSARICGQS